MNDPRPEPHDPVWRLLDKARSVKVHPGFSLRVVKSIEHHQKAEPRRGFSPRALWTPPARRAWLAAAAVMVVTGWWRAHPRAESRQVEPLPAAAAVPDPTDELAAQFASELAMIDEVEALLAPESAHDLVEEDIEQLLF